MSERNDGGRAFPGKVLHRLGNSTVAVYSGGMSLRDYFAGYFVGQILTTVDSVSVLYKPEGIQLVAQYGYRLADAMLAERAK